MTTRPSTFQCIRWIVHDLITDIRDDNASPDYRNQCRRDLTTLFRERHRERLDRYGWPNCLKEGSNQ